LNTFIHDRGKELEEEFKGKYETVQELTDAVGAALKRQFFGEE
jgi:hypothetical protein